MLRKGEQAWRIQVRERALSVTAVMIVQGDSFVILKGENDV